MCIYISVYLKTENVLYLKSIIPSHQELVCLKYPRFYGVPIFKGYVHDSKHKGSGYPSGPFVHGFERVLIFQDFRRDPETKKPKILRSK